MSKPTSRRRRTRVGVSATIVAAVVGAALIFMPTFAAATVTAPDPTTQCFGSLAKDPTDAAANDEPTLVGYAFHCYSQDPQAGAITSYSLIITRPNDDRQNLIDFDGNPDVTFPGSFPADPTEAGQPDLNTSVLCGGSTPSDGINCFSETTAGGVLAAAPGWVPANEVVTGWITPSESICAYLPKGAKPGTPAVPRATVELIVTDAPDQVALTLSSALASSPAITALPVDAISSAIPSGSSVTIDAGSGSTLETQTFVTSAAVAAGATSIPITSATPNYAYPTSSITTAYPAGSPTGLTEDGPFELTLPSGACPKVPSVVPKPKPKPKPKHKKSSKK